MRYALRQTAFTITSVFLILFAPLSFGAIIEISVPPNSQGGSRPQIDNVWDVAANGGALDINRGIGIIINPTFVSANDYTDFAMHQDGSTHPYTSDYIPFPETSTITFFFYQSTIVRYVDIAQHGNGVTKLAGSIGDTLNTLTSIGSVFGPAGDIKITGLVSYEGEIQRFDFGNTTNSGTIFQLTVVQSLHPSAFAFHRAFLIDPSGVQITGAVPEISTIYMLLAGLSVISFGRIRRWGVRR